MANKIVKILLDENVANKIKEGLIELGISDTKHINEKHKGIPDEEVYELAQREERVLITGDDDFKNNIFKYKISIIWITPKARYDSNICNKIKWILDNAEKHSINLKRAFIAIRKDRYCIEYRNKDTAFAKIRKMEIKFENVKD